MVCIIPDTYAIRRFNICSMQMSDIDNPAALLRAYQVEGHLLNRQIRIFYTQASFYGAPVTEWDRERHPNNEQLSLPYAPYTQNLEEPEQMLLMTDYDEAPANPARTPSFQQRGELEEICSIPEGRMYLQRKRYN
jgi:hypothetical protein